MLAVGGFAPAATQPVVAPLLAPASQAGPRAFPDGRAFAEITLPASPQAGEIRLDASRGWTWQESRTNRLLLERDVRITLGLYQFAAKRAVVWIEPVRIAGQDASQVAVYLDEAASVPGAAPIEQTAGRLLITGIILTGAPILRADRLERSRPDDALIAEGESRLGLYLAEVAGIAPPLAQARDSGPSVPGAGARPTRPAEPQPAPLSAAGVPWPPPDDRGVLPPAERLPIEPAEQGTITPFAERIEFVAASEEQTARGDGPAIVLSGGVALTYSRLDTPQSPSGRGGERLRRIELTAQRAVVFLAPSAGAGRARYDLGQVQGAYLEGDVVASSTGYTLRGARMYYDFKTERAVVLDAVFWTYDADRGMPLYLRAGAIRQESRSQWSAHNVRMANVGFAKPHFAIGATDITLTTLPASEETGAPPRQSIDATDVKFLVGDVPLVFARRMRGEFRPSPLRRIEFGSLSGDPVVRSEWDIYTLAGLDPAPGNSASLLLDGYFNRGPAIGANLDWNAPDISGSLFAYYIRDSGTDQLPSGGEIKHQDDDRGIIDADQVWRLTENWTLFTEFSYISDETFVPTFFREEAETHREYASSLYARYLDEKSLLSLEVRGTVNDFTANQYLLQSLGYQTQKFPEFAYSRLGDELLGGVVRYSSESRFSLMSLAFTEPTVRELGFKSLRDARKAFGLLPGDSIGDALRARGLDEDTVARVDTRHEFEAPLQAGPVNITPFAVGRITAWDTNFDDFSGDSGQDNARLWGSLGVRFGTSLQRVYDAVEIDALDVHQIRHIIEPNGTIWYADTNLSQQNLPVFDDDVESLAEGFATRIGVRNTLQTRRGGEGRWQTVDWLVVDTNFIFSDDNGPLESPFGRFIDTRPEQSILGDFLSNDIMLRLTDAVALTNQMIFSFDDNSLARASFGLLIDHGLGFSTYLEYRNVQALSESFLNLGVQYELTRKYQAAITAVYDTDLAEFQTLGLRLTRRFPQWTVDFNLGLDNISSDISLGVSLRPAGLGGDRRTRVLTRDLQNPADLRGALPDRERLHFGPFADLP